MQMSTYGSRQALNIRKGNHRRMIHLGINDSWAYMKYM
jgi:hypothetical protein